MADQGKPLLDMISAISDMMPKQEEMYVTCLLPNMQCAKREATGRTFISPMAYSKLRRDLSPPPQPPSYIGAFGLPVGDADNIAWANYSDDETLDARSRTRLQERQTDILSDLFGLALHVYGDDGPMAFTEYIEQRRAPQTTTPTEQDERKR